MIKELIMKEKTKESKRYSRSYKCIDEVYFAGMEKAKQNKTVLAQEVEKFVIKYAQKNNGKKS